MSADLLRRAAALMRERAESATLHPKYSLPWMVDLDKEDEPRIVLAPKDVGGWDGMIVARCIQADDAEHIASWHPAVALAVADWLDATASTLVTYRAGYAEALIVARAYLGEQP